MKNFMVCSLRQMLLVQIKEGELCRTCHMREYVSIGKLKEKKPFVDENRDGRVILIFALK